MPSDKLPLNLSSSLLRRLLLSRSRDIERRYCRSRPYRSLSPDLRLRGDLLRLRGEERERRLGDMDLRLRGERLIRRRGAARGLMSRDRSLPGPISTRGRFLSGESCLSNSLLLGSGERLRTLLGEDLVLEGEWLCLAVLSEALADGWRASRCRGEALRLLGGLWGALLCGERFSFPDEASFEGDLVGRLSRSVSERLGRSRAGDLDRLLARSWFGLSSRCGEERLSERLAFCSALKLDGELDFLLSFAFSVLCERFRSFDLLLPRPLSLALESLVLLVTLSGLDSFAGFSADLLRLRRLELDLLPSVESRLDFPLLPPLGEMGLPELPL